MKNVWAGLVAAAVLAVGCVGMRAQAPLAAVQDLTGTWQGTLHAGQQDLRIVAKFTNDDGKWRGAAYSIDQPGPAMNMTTVTLQGGTLKFAIPQVGGDYEGKMGPDGNSIVGNWTQGQPLPLTLVRATKETAWEIPAPPPPPKMMTDTDPSFEVATIKPSDPEHPGMFYIVRGHQLETNDTTLAFLIKFVYGLHDRQMAGAPDWVMNDKFTITAPWDGEKGVPNANQLKVMVKKLLAERFQLKFHMEKRELSVYTLTVSKNGLKATVNDTKGPLPGYGMSPKPGGLLSSIHNTTMQEYAEFLQTNMVDRPVVDQTGLTSKYDFNVTFLPDETMFGGHATFKPQEGAEQAPNFFSAIQQDAGLKLDAVKAPADVMVIDHVEKPSAN